MPRAITAYASAYQRTRGHLSRVTRGQVFTLTANFNAVLASGVTIASVVWKVNQTQSVILGAAAINASPRTVEVACTAGVGPGGVVKCQITDSDGEVHNQLFDIRVSDGPWYAGETTPAAGSSSVSA